MQYLINQTNELKSQGEIRKLHTNTSLPRVFDANVCEFLDITPVLAVPKPETTELQSAYRNGVTTDGLGNTVEAWGIRDMFSDTEEDGVTTTKAEHEEAYMAKKLEALKLSIESATEKRLEDAAKGRGYKSLDRLLNYTNSTNEKWATEAVYMQGLQTQTWEALLSILAAVNAGTREAPASYEEIEPELPVIDWPE
jgi:hypothetical protein